MKSRGSSKHEPSKRERQFKHILESYLDRGVPLKLAEAHAAATVNKYRAKQARKHQGPKLVTQGGSRRQWYPGKVGATFVCLKHKRKFKTRAAMLSHYRSHA